MRKNILVATWLILLLIMLGMFFLPPDYRLNVFIFIFAPISTIYGLINFSLTQKVKFDIKLQYLLVSGIVSMFACVSLINKSTLPIYNFFRLFFLSMFLLFVILSLWSGIFYKRNKNTVLRDYAPTIKFCRVNDNAKGWINAYFWVAFISVGIFMLLLKDMFLR
ncbi:MAG: hypothetical protein WC552_01425 [Candidatus Omnitrophota bacterium]